MCFIIFNPNLVGKAKQNVFLKSHNGLFFWFCIVSNFFVFLVFGEMSYIAWEVGVEDTKLGGSQWEEEL